MDRRQEKTRDAVFTAFITLLQHKRYGQITVQNIIDEANIGRSTFYSHFETKDELLKAMCTEIFEHIFSNGLMSEKTHDFSSDSIGLAEKLTHLLYHLKDKQTVICGILSSDSREIFMRYFKEYLRDLFTKYTAKDDEIPYEYVINNEICSFAETVNWWAKKKMSYTPEELVSFYLKTNPVP